MTWGVTIPLSGCEVGDHDIVPILGYENSIVGEQCRQCGIEIKKGKNLINAQGNSVIF